MKYVCSENKCTGCMACMSTCPKKAISIKDDLFALNAVIDESLCIDCGLCHKVCQVCTPVELKKPISWKQGWSEEYRKESSSGGFAAAISHSFIESGGVVCSCIFSDGNFVFDVAKSHEKVCKFTGSKYVKSNPIQAYRIIKEELLNGKRCLFIGLPCQVAGLKKTLSEKLKSNLYTVDLICHGSPSVKLLDYYLTQHGYPLSGVDSIIFRRKESFGISSKHQMLSKYGTADCYTIAFLNSLTYTENCYSCGYAKLERVSDLTLGDSWGSELPQDEQKKGISIAISQTVKGEELLRLANLTTYDVDLKKAVSVNHQLVHPSVAPKAYKSFFNAVQANKNFDLQVWKIFPRLCFRQWIKKVLIRFKIIGGGLLNNYRNEK